MNCGLMIKFIYEKYLNLLWILLYVIGYLCKSLRIINTMVSWRSIWCNSFCGVFAGIRWTLSLWSSLSMNNIWIFWILLCMIGYLCKSLRIISLVWPTRLIFLAMGEVLSFEFNLAVSFPSDSRGSKAHIVLLPSRIKRWGSYCLSLSLYIMSSCLMCYSVLMNLIL